MSSKNQRKYIHFSLAILFFLLFSHPAFAGPWQPLVTTAKRFLAAGSYPIGAITVRQNDDVIINLTTQGLHPGMMVAVKGTSMRGIPQALQNDIAVIRLNQIVGNQARGVIIEGYGNFQTGTPVFPHTYNALYLYTNIANPKSFPPYLDLSRELQQAGIFYHELKSPTIPPGVRPLIIRFEGQYNRLFATLTDINNAVLTQKSFTLSYSPPLVRQIGVPLGLATQQQNQSNSFTKPARTNGHGIFNRLELKSAYNRFVFADLDGNGSQEIIFVNQRRLEAYRLDNGRLIPVARYKITDSDVILGLHQGDFNHNGKDELYLSSGKIVTVMDKNDTQLNSFILELQGKSFSVLEKSLPYYFRVMETRGGKRILLVQEIDRYKQYKLPIKWGGFKSGKFSAKNEYQEAHNVFSLYNFVPNPFNKKQLLVLDMKGTLGGFDAPTEELIATATESFGLYDEIIYPQKLEKDIYKGGFSIKETTADRRAARRFTLKNSFGQQAFLIKKGRKIQLDVVEKGISMIKGEENEQDQVVGVQWKNSNIVETWKSPPIPRDVIDFGFTRLKGKDVMVIMTRNNAGKYALEMVK